MKYKVAITILLFGTLVGVTFVTPILEPEVIYTKEGQYLC